MIVSPTAGFDALEAPFVVLAAAFGAMASLTFATAVATGPFFLAGGAAAGSVAGAFLFRNSGGHFG